MPKITYLQNISFGKEFKVAQNKDVQYNTIQYYMHVIIGPSESLKQHAMPEKHRYAEIRRQVMEQKSKLSPLDISSTRPKIQPGSLFGGAFAATHLRARSHLVEATAEAQNDSLRPTAERAAELGEGVRQPRDPPKHFLCPCSFSLSRPGLALRSNKPPAGGGVMGKNIENPQAPDFRPF